MGVHAAGTQRGLAYHLAPLEGTRAAILIALRSRAPAARVQFWPLQRTIWQIEGGLSYSEMTPESRALIDELVPEYKRQLRENFVRTLQRVCGGSGILKKLASGMCNDINNMMASYQQTQRTLQRYANNYQVLAQQIVHVVPGTYPNAGPTSWSQLNPRVYARVTGGQIYNEDANLEIRVLPSSGAASPIANRRNGGILRNASYTPPQRIEPAQVSANDTADVPFEAVIAYPQDFLSMQGLGIEPHQPPVEPPGGSGSLVGIKNVITAAGISVTSSPACNILIAQCFSVQQNFWVWDPTTDSANIWWVQNAVILMKDRSGEWFVQPAFNAYTAGQVGSEHPTKQGRVWVPIPFHFDRLTLTSRISSGALELTTRLGPRQIADFHPTGIVSAHSEIEDAVPFAPQQAGYPQLMLVGSQSARTACFWTGSSGTVASYVRSGDGPWSPAVAEQTVEANTPTKEKSTGLVFGAPVQVWSNDNSSSWVSTAVAQKSSTCNAPTGFTQQGIQFAPRPNTMLNHGPIQPSPSQENPPSHTISTGGIPINPPIQQPPAPGASPDQAIVSSMNAKLWQDPVLKTQDIRVSSQNGTVTLEGTVSTQAEKTAVERIAQTTKGVRLIIDRMAIATAPEPGRR